MHAFGILDQRKVIQYPVNEPCDPAVWPIVDAAIWCIRTGVPEFPIRNSSSESRQAEADSLQRQPDAGQRAKRSPLSRLDIETDDRPRREEAHNP